MYMYTPAPVRSARSVMPGHVKQAGRAAVETFGKYRARTCAGDTIFLQVTSRSEAVYAARRLGLVG